MLKKARCQVVTPITFIKTDFPVFYGDGEIKKEDFSDRRSGFYR
jgi:hypothetical protein